MVSVLVSRSSGPGSSPFGDIAFCSRTKEVPLSTQMNKWVTENLRRNPIENSSNFRS